MNTAKNNTICVVYLLITAFILQSTSLMAQPNSLTPKVADSLQNIWEDNNQPDTSRLMALHTIDWEGYLFTNPDSALYFVELELKLIHSFIKRKGEKKVYMKYKSSALNTKGASYYIQGNYAVAIEYFTQSLKIKEKMGDKEGIAASINNIGLIYKELGNLEKALENLEKCLKLEESLKDQQGVGITLSNIGGIHQQQGNNKLAIDYFNRSLNILEELNDKEGIASTLNNIGVIYQEQGEYNRSLIYFEKSLKLREELGDQRAVASSLNNIGNNYKLQNDFNTALKYSLRSLEITRKLGAATQTKYAAQSLWEIYKNLGRFKDALAMHELFISVRDSIASEENQKEVIRHEFQYEYEKQAALDSVEHAKEKQLSLATIAKKEAESEKKDAEIKAQRNLQYALIGGLILLFVFGGFMYNRFQITSKQKRIIEHQKTEVEEQKKLVEESHKEITDSIQYAKRIQTAILPSKKIIKDLLPNSFILYKPKDVVAGDFYWIESVDNKILFAVADCTGHGVPGAIVSVVCNNGLNRSIREHNHTIPSKILDKTREIILQEFEKSEDEVKDGMDIALCSLEGNTLQYAGANNPLWIIRNREVIETKANKQPIGKFDKPQPYTNHIFELQKNDTVYIFSDGFADQFGGEKGKKFKAANLKSLLVSVQEKNMEEQYVIINNAFEEWKGQYEQVDDICVIGIKI